MKDNVPRIARMSVVVFGLAMTLAVGFAFMPVQTQPQRATATQTFDHSGCQYPERWTNPVDGCDNSDPAVPECIKSAWSEESEKSCIALISGQITEVETPKTPTSNPSSGEKPNVAQCSEGK